MKGYQIKRKQKPEDARNTFQKFSGILMVSAWGFAMVLSSFLFLYIGYIVDELLGTSPNFMLCSFFLAIGLCMWRIYKEAAKKGQDMKDDL